MSSNEPPEIAPEDEPTPPHGTPSLPVRDPGRRVARRAPPPTGVDRHQRLMLEMVARIEARITRRGG